MLSDMNNLFNHLTFPKRSHLLWLAWLRAIQPLRPARSPTTTFLWLVGVLGSERPKLRTRLVTPAKSGRRQKAARTTTSQRKGMVGEQAGRGGWMGRSQARQ